MNTTTINSKKYFYKMTISACKKFKHQFSVDVTSADYGDVEQIQAILFLGLEAGTNLEKKDSFDLTIEQLDELDLEELTQKILEVAPVKK